MTDVQLRVEPAHDEVFIRLAMKDMGWSALAPAVDAHEGWMPERRGNPAGALRQVPITDQLTPTPPPRSAISASRGHDEAAVALLSCPHSRHQLVRWVGKLIVLYFKSWELHSPASFTTLR